MSDCSVIYEIISNPDTENLRVEYKRFGILETKGGRKKFIKEILDKFPNFRAE